MIKDWQIKTIEEIAKTTSGGTPSRTNKDYYSGDILWVKSGELNDNFIHDTEEKITGEAVKNSSAKLFPIGTVLMAMYGATVGKTAILRNEATTNQAVCGIIPYADKCDNEFLRFQFMFKREDFLKQRYGGAQPNISQTIIKTFDVLLPPLNEQKKIAYVLSTIQKAIQQQDKLISHTTELKKALMQKLFTEGTKGEKQKQTEIGSVPESWAEITIGDLGKCVTGTTPKTAFVQYWNSNDFDFIAPADIGNTKYVYNSSKMMSHDGLKVSRVLPKNSVLCVCIGSSIGKVGLTFKDQSATNQQINSIICKADYNPIFTYYLMVHYAEHWRGHATFGPVPILNKGQFELIKLFVSKDKKEQSIIANSLQTLDNKIEFHGKKKQTLSGLFKTLLHDLMTGERRVHEIEFETINKKYKIKELPLRMAAED